MAAGYLSRGDVLRYEVIDGARHAVVVGPAIDHRQGRAKVAVLRRGVGGLPLQRGGIPRVAARRLAFEITPYEVVQEHQLDGAHDQRRDGDPLVHEVGRCGEEVSTSNRL